MSRQPDSPGSDYMNRYYELGKPVCPEDGFGAAQAHFPHGLAEALPEDPTQFGRSPPGTAAPPRAQQQQQHHHHHQQHHHQHHQHHQQFVQFLSVAGDYTYTGPEARSAVAPPRPGYHLSESDYTAWVTGVTGVRAAAHLFSPTFAAPDGGSRERLVMPPAGVKAEDGEQLVSEPELRPPYSPSSPAAGPSTATATSGSGGELCYVHPKARSFWPGYPRHPTVNGSPAATVASSSSESPSPPCERFPGGGGGGGGTPGAPGVPGTSQVRRPRQQHVEQVAASGSAAAAAASARIRSRSGGDTDVEDTVPHEEMRQFARRLKQLRVTMGFTQSDLGIALGNLSGKLFSQTTICRFEAMQLSYRNMCDLKEVLEQWMVAVQMMDDPQDMCRPAEPPKVEVRTRKRRTNLDGASRTTLEHYFVMCPRPSANEITNIAKRLNLQRDVVRIWFCNRRQKGRRENTVVEDRFRMEQMHLEAATPGSSSALEQNDPSRPTIPNNPALYVHPEAQSHPKPKM
ncbi:POU domain, class 5, transcription factor 3-like isoform X2 [Scleropages formosus]|uniref:POU domain, class 5, transcription factor 3-like isoform X2 n=1 Tax=Scleropages formosus TaxID=113540 RepID=UPI0010FAB922|nr:POU domain, class 5, transcription factor 3-like isoform X2 [Scleropages formosus]